MRTETEFLKAVRKLARSYGAPPGRVEKLVALSRNFVTEVMVERPDITRQQAYKAAYEVIDKNFQREFGGPMMAVDGQHR